MRMQVRSGLLAAVILLAGCAANNQPAPAPVVLTQEARDQLQQVRDSYNAGRYGDVIRQVATSDVLHQSTSEVRIEALKLQSFSYCLTDYRQLCEDGFRRILAIDPSFTLAPSEAGHPQWGPVFRQAKGSQNG
ncbi:TssQ family T6SS-associated lipoprotein [Bordetella ansorpii]|nr:TssQ family T6SS-associated lipoprotein [Bordetella ansorpii]